MIGAGGHAKVVADAILRTGKAMLGVYDSDLARHKSVFLEQYEVLMFSPANMANQHCHVAIGSNEIRERLSLELLISNAVLVTVAHSDSSVSRFAEIGAGSFIAARAVVGPGAKIGAGTIVNHAAIIDHDCMIGAYCHVAPGAVLGGGVRIGNKCLVGAGAIILPGVAVGSDVTIGAGAVVTKDVPPFSTWIGVPAKMMESKQNG